MDPSKGMLDLNAMGVDEWFPVVDGEAAYFGGIAGSSSAGAAASSFPGLARELFGAEGSPFVEEDPAGRGSGHRLGDGKPGQGGDSDDVAPALGAATRKVRRGASSKGRATASSKGRAAGGSLAHCAPAGVAHCVSAGVARGLSAGVGRGAGDLNTGASDDDAAVPQGRSGHRLGRGAPPAVGRGDADGVGHGRGGHAKGGLYRPPRPACAGRGDAEDSHDGDGHNIHGAVPSAENW
uniref:Uncharacterized protein n=1 Tax=Arundo donax TaxID=35708 RepID=A0A0A9ES26_ARUDO